MDDERDRYEVAGMSSEPARAPVTEPRAQALPIAVGAGVVAAIVGGVLWGLIVKWSDYEVGIVAWGIGFVVATAILLATRGAKGRPLQVVAVVCALLGILLGKYLGYALIVQEEASSFGESIGLFSGDMVSFFREDLGNVFGLFDLLWVGLAVFTAWRTLEPDEPEHLPSAPAE